MAGEPAGAPYHKIHGLWKRTEKGQIMAGEFAKPEFEYLFDMPWQWTEKIDGTNIRLHWTGKKVLIGGRTDNAQIPADLLNKLAEYTDPEFVAWADVFGNDPATLYGEGCGAGIQKNGGRYIPDGKDFILFDINIGGSWLNRWSQEQIASRLGLKIVPQFFAEATPKEMHNLVSRNALFSDFGDFTPEGYVGTPTVPLFNRFGERIAVKIKAKDYL